MPAQDDKKNEYGQTLNLPQTDFAMRGNLPQKEPDILAKWDEMDIYAEVQKKNSGRPQFILHDGPPYANGDIHLGHALNKVLKDIIVKYKSMRGFDSPYVPGWDTHGLPIEQKAIKDLGINRKSVSTVDFRNRCREFAIGYVEQQSKQFRRLGITGNWKNPYVTLTPDYEAIQIGAFGEMAKKGYVYKGLKPVYWCPQCETALAEAEIEYEEHRSASIFVKMPVCDGKGLVPEGAFVVIWTTTPWTIPANLAVSINPDCQYVLVAIQNEQWLVAKEMLDSFLAEAKLAGQPYEIVAEFKGEELENIKYRHPLFDRVSPVILGKHVTMEAGTGCVHTAPGHGVDDFNVGRQYGLDVLSPVDDQGRFTEEAGPFAGLDTAKEGNKAVVKALEECGALIHFAMFSHQYPHCWRCHTPILFRATEQWFASIDQFRKQALEEIDKVEFVPAWGRDRIYNMIRDRGDWCISRQRVWGVPIPIFFCEDCGQYIINDDTISHLQNIFRAEGSQAWWAHDIEYLLPQGFSCPHCGGKHFRQETDTMDVWFDSGSSSFSVLENDRWPELSAPADLYLEGSDQHRGWFNSSLCISVANRGIAPYRKLLTHGFLVDEEGKKQSKSKGNTISPLEITDKFGADILRLWVSSVDYRSDISNSMNIFKQTGESYRKLRNTLRYLLGNLYDFSIEKDIVAYEDMQPLDQWAMRRFNKLVQTVLTAYDEYEFHVVFHSIHKFCVLDMSAFYLDVIKDTLYVLAPDAAERRSAQTVLYHLATDLVRLLTPILAFTTEEVYQYLPKPTGSPASVQLLDMPEAKEYPGGDIADEMWEQFLACRDLVMAKLEAARRDKIIGHPLDAAVAITPDKANAAMLQELKDDLPRLLIVSQVQLNAAGENEEPIIKVAQAKGAKCGRCWVFSATVGQNSKHPCLCQRCAEVLA